MSKSVQDSARLGGYRIIVEFEFEFRVRVSSSSFEFERYSLRCTSKAGVRFLISPRREEQTIVAMSVL